MAVLNEDQVGDAFARCTFVDECGDAEEQCDGCPMRDWDRVQKGNVCCDAYEKSGNISIPQELAEMVNELLARAANRRKTMRWIECRKMPSYPFFDCKCSVCGYKTPSVLYGWKYCPACGAKTEEDSKS